MTGPASPGAPQRHNHTSLPDSRLILNWQTSHFEHPLEGLKDSAAPADVDAVRPILSCVSNKMLSLFKHFINYHTMPKVRSLFPHSLLAHHFCFDFPFFPHQQKFPALVTFNSLLFPRNSSPPFDTFTSAHVSFSTTALMMNDGSTLI